MQTLQLNLDPRTYSQSHHPVRNHPVPAQIRFKLVNVATAMPLRSERILPRNQAISSWKRDHKQVLTNTEQLKRIWAFAKKPSMGRRVKDAGNAVITACSVEAKALGIRTGMRYEEAKLLVPDMRILVIGGQRR